MSHPYGPQQPRPGQPWPPPHKKSRAHVYILVIAMLLITGFGCFAAGRGDRASNRVTMTVTETARVTVTVTAPRPRPKSTRAARTGRTAKPSPRPTRRQVRTPRPTRRPSVESGVHPGAFCSDEGALGRTVKGTLMRCTSKPGDRARWRQA